MHTHSDGKLTPEAASDLATDNRHTQQLPERSLTAAAKGL